MSFSLGLPWSEGEETMHRLLHVPPQDNPTSPQLTPQAAYMLQAAPLLAVGTLDAQKRPWTTVWGGEPGFSRPLGGGMVGIKTRVDRKYDPVIQALVGGGEDGEVVREEGRGRMVGGLTIDLATRKRVKLFGRMVAGALGKVGQNEGDEGGEGEVQLVVRVEQSLGNCPKYLNKKEIEPARMSPKVVSESPQLPKEALDFLKRADLFFVSSSNSDYDMDTNHRGGPPGFVRVVSNSDSDAELVWPEYSGNRLYQTLGNLQTTPLAGLVFPDFETGDVLYVTGTTEILIGNEAAAVLPRSNLAVKLKVADARFVRQALPFRGTAGEPSPYNPNVRLLATEGSIGAQLKSTTNTARLIEQTPITSTISRYRFAMTNPFRYAGGQWVALDFSEELDNGYSHMRDDDPRSLNDDFVRTFTISSSPVKTEGVPHDEFEITIRRVGAVTSFLSRQNARSGIEVPIRGFGGEFVIKAPPGEDVIPFVAGGVGITPLLGQLSSLDMSKLRLLWTLRMDDLDLVVDTIERYPELAPSTSVFLTGKGADSDSQQESKLAKLREAGVRAELRRLLEEDLQAVGARTWYLCTGRGLQLALVNWLKEKTLVYEDFNF